VAQINWLNTDGGTWTTAADWSGGTVPGTQDAAVISAGAETGAQYTVDIESAVAVQSLDLDSAGATLDIGDLTAGGSLSASDILLQSGTLALGDGTLSGTVQATGGQFVYDYYDEAGATLNGVTWEGAFAPVFGGINPDAVLSITNGLILTGKGGSGPGTMTLQNGATLRFEGAEVLDNANVSIGGTNYSAGNTASILAAPEGATEASLTFGAHLSLKVNGVTVLATDGAITNDGTITAIHGPLEIQGDGVFTNDGVIDIAGGSVTESIGQFANNGTIDVTDGGVLTITTSATSNFSNTGSIDAAGGSVFFAGTVTTAALTSFEAAYGGSLGLSGTLLNEGGTLALGTDALPSLTLGTGGVIDGGTITGGDLSLDGGTLSSVTYLGNLNVHSLIIADGITLESASGAPGGSINVTRPNANLHFSGSQTLANAAIAFGDASGANSAYNILGIGTYDAGAGGTTTLTLASSTVLDVYGSDGGSVFVQGDTLVNDGLIDGSSNGSVTFNLYNFSNEGSIGLRGTGSGTGANDLFIEASTFTNTGNISLSDGALLTFFGQGDVFDPPTGTWSNTGTISVAESELQIGGTLTAGSLNNVHTSAGATVVLSGILQNAGETLSVGGGSALGTLTLGGPLYYDSGEGTIQGGTIEAASGALDIVNGVLSGVVYTGNIDLSGANVGLTITDGFRFADSGSGTIALTGDSATLTFLGSERLAHAVIDIGSDDAPASIVVQSQSTAATVTLKHSSTIDQGGAAATEASIVGVGTGSTLVNEGQIIASAQSGSLSVSDIDFVDAGRFTVSNGTTAELTSTDFTNSGTLAIVGQGSMLQIDTDLAPASFANTGLVRVEGGALAYGPFGGSYPSYSWSNTGTIVLSKGGILYLNQDVSTVALGTIDGKGGTIALGATLDNTGRILRLGHGSTLGTIVLDGGVIEGGTIFDRGPGLISTAASGGTLDGVTSDGVLDLSAANTRFNIRDGITVHRSVAGAGTILLTGAGSTLDFEGAATQTLDNATIVLGGGATLSGDALILGSNLRIDQTGSGTISGPAMTDYGTIAIAPGAGTLSLQTDYFYNEGTLAVGAGDEVSDPGLLTNDGVISLAGGTMGLELGISNDADSQISGFGTLNAAVDNEGTLSASGGTLTVEGAISDYGKLQADAGATLILSSSVSALQTATFAGGNAVIGLAPMSFLGAIAGFAHTDTLDLLNIQASAAQFSGDSIIVTLTAGGTLSLDTSSALSGSLSVGADGAGGTDLTFAGSNSHVEEHGAVVFSPILWRH
jgi:hypothetical protein